MSRSLGSTPRLSKASSRSTTTPAFSRTARTRRPRTPMPTPVSSWTCCKVSKVHSFAMTNCAGPGKSSRLSCTRSRMTMSNQSSTRRADVAQRRPTLSSQNVLATCATWTTPTRPPCEWSESGHKLPTFGLRSWALDLIECIGWEIAMDRPTLTSTLVHTLQGTLETVRRHTCSSIKRGGTFGSRPSRHILGFRHRSIATWRKDGVEWSI
mmetsp:Transcript_21098/g.58688  ORF Transcript_21098/g.58688 Transcript_21098/m.58688 type:complete len:210 (+) Transcript_21098:907-1536(+)